MKLPSSTCGRITLLIFGALGVCLNFHYPFLALVGMGRPLALFVEGLLSSRMLLSSINSLWLSSVKRKMIAGGMPEPNRTLQYVSTPKPLLVDVYDFGSAKARQKRPAVLYFHAGSFNTGGRQFGAGTTAFLAAHGYVGLSASYTLTVSGDGGGVTRCIDDAWRALQWTQRHAGDLGVDPRKIIVAGDSAGGGLALALATGLGSKAYPDVLRPAAAVVGWAVTTFDPLEWGTRRVRGEWSGTPADIDIQPTNAFVPIGTGPTPEAASRQVQQVFVGPLLFHGRAYGGWLPASSFLARPLAERAEAAFSPLTAADTRGLPPILMFVGEEDEVVPPGQQHRFADIARRAGNRVTVISFPGAAHGGGGANCATGRAAILRFLEGNGLRAPRTSAAARADEFIEIAKRAFGVSSDEYRAYRPLRPWWPNGRATMRMTPLAPAASK